MVPPVIDDMCVGLNVFFISALGLSALLAPTGAGKILCYFTMPSISHQVVFQPIWRELSLRGHDVTVITPNPIKDPSLTNLTEIDVSHSYKKLNYKAFSGALTHWTLVPWYYEIMENVTEDQLSNPEVRKLLADQTAHFDVVMVEYLHPIPSAMAARFRSPLIGIVSLGTMDVEYDSAGIPVHPILSPNIGTTFGIRLDFVERVESVLYNLWFRWYYHYSGVLDRMEAIARRHLGNEIPPLLDIERNVSMLFLNTNPVIHGARPLPPNVIEMGRMHLKPSKPLPEGLKRFLDSSSEGVIYFSLGSNVKSNLIDEEKRKLIAETFSELPYKILWKFESDSLPGKPKNVRIEKWLPQQDVLGHPNIKMFITQAGLQSLEEAIINKVPLLAMPFIGDQFFNAEKIEALGIGLYSDFKSLTKESFKSAILEIVQNPKYKAKMNEISQIILDEPMTGLEKAIWWTEYVIRHKGAVYLKNPAVNMSWVQFLLLDVLAFLLASALLALYSLYKLFASFKSLLTVHVKRKTS